MATIHDDDLLKVGVPDPLAIVWIGATGYAWAKLDVLISAAFASILDIDPIELGILFGRIETQAKLAKMQAILEHRRDPRAKTVRAIKKAVDKIRPIRNTVIHGHYIGITDKGVMLFEVASEFMIDGDTSTIREEVPLDKDEIKAHIKVLTDQLPLIQQNFDAAKMRAAMWLPARTRKESPAPDAPGKARKRRQRRHRSSPK